MKSGSWTKRRARCLLRSKLNMRDEGWIASHKSHYVPIIIRLEISLVTKNKYRIVFMSNRVNASIRETKTKLSYWPRTRIMLCVEKQYFYETTWETRVTNGEENNTATKITYKSNHINAQSKNVKAQRFLSSASINDNEPSLCIGKFEITLTL